MQLAGFWFPEQGLNPGPWQWKCRVLTTGSLVTLLKSPLKKEIQFSCSVVSDSLRVHGLQYTRPPCPSPTLQACSNSCPLSCDANHFILCHPLLLLPSIFPSNRVFSNESFLRIRWPEDWSFSFSISPSMNIQDWFPLGLTGLISLLFKGLSRVFFDITVQKHQFFGSQFFL